jgi:hypothetical protein
MSNSAKGEIEFEALGKAWRGALDTNARCSMEDEFEKGFPAIVMDTFGITNPEDANDPAKVMEAARRLEFRVVRSFLFHGLKERQPDLTVNMVGKIMDDLGERRAMEIVGQMASISTPEVKDAGSAGGNSSRGKKQSAGRPG